MFNLEQGAELVRLARHAIETIILNQPLDIEKYKKLEGPYGVYITLKKDGKLRGQMGTLEKKDPLYKAVMKAARDSALNDKRFEAVTKDELKEVEVEVDLIFNIRLLKVINSEQYIKLIHPETDGIMIRSGVFSAIMLPNPEMRSGWDVERLLRHLCMTAGLTMDAWKSMDENIYIFQVQIFAEKNKRIVELI